MSFIVAIIALLKDEPEAALLICLLGLIEVIVWGALILELHL